MVTVTVATGAFALVLAAAHVLAGRLSTLDPLSHDATLSFAGGVSVAYVFVLLLPEINEAVLDLVESREAVGSFFSRDVHVYVVVLLGFVLFYGIHSLVTQARSGSEGAGDAAGADGAEGGNDGDGASDATGDEDASDAIFWAHVLSFTGYNALIGYLLFHQEESGLLNLLFYTVALALHFLVIDAGFRRHHGSVYDRVGRWILSGAVLVGAGVGLLMGVSEALLAVLFAFLAGSVVFNSIKEELPSPAGSRFVAFLGGAGLYTAILLFA
ncbi:hypothetical protein [Halomarina pelagica]|uniref:hypothetical protein n=1 Tax=Halomarina pelagica TaxID=2961599 RepID=UPI0020C579A4|nr:hypothetical protein [Halomarina sp. BND7]